jgi:putative tryptophan/tyrosine transport system substrate-binding protein
MSAPIGSVHGHRQQVGGQRQTAPTWCSTIGCLVTLALLLVPLASEAQQATKVHRIGRLLPGSPPSAGGDPGLEDFRQGLRDLGYVEGQNLSIEYRYAEGSEERLRDLAAELVRLQVEVIVAGGSAAIRAAQQATRTIPIVMASSGDPVGREFVASLAHPAGNITGMSNFVADLPGKQMELLKEAVPRRSRMAVLTNPASPGAISGTEMENLAVATKALGVQLQVVHLRSRDELDGAFAAMSREGAEALVVLSEPLLIDRTIRAIVDLAAQYRLPAIYRWRSQVQAGGLMSYGPNQPAIWRRYAYYVDRILKGANPGDLPVEQPTKFELIINLKTAQALDLTIPPTLLFQADEVIK